MTRARRTAWVTDERMLLPPAAPMAGFLPADGLLEEDETSIDRLGAAAARRVQSLVARSGLHGHLTPVAAAAATRSELMRVHDAWYVDAVRAAATTGGAWVGDHTWVGPGGDVLAALAAGACIAAVAAVLEGRADNAYALVWPPGHHAQAGVGAGFCVFGNVALAAHAALTAGVRRIAIIDWDAHRSDGTHAAFAESERVLTISLHQEKPADTLSPNTTVAAIDVPLPLASGPAAYAQAFADVVAPAVTRHRPQLLLVSCGFDAGTLDPMARLTLHSEAFRELTRATVALAASTCDGRLVLCHEGGYSPAYVPVCALAVVEELCGVRTGFEDPFLRRWQPFAAERLRPEEAAAVARAADALGGTSAP